MNCHHELCRNVAPLQDGLNLEAALWHAAIYHTHGKAFVVVRATWLVSQQKGAAQQDQAESSCKLWLVQAAAKARRKAFSRMPESKAGTMMLRLAAPHKHTGHLEPGKILGCIF